MNRLELIDLIAEEADLTKSEAAAALDAIIKIITSTLKKHDTVRLLGFGSFSVTKRSARLGRNPQTGRELKIASKYVAKFRAGSDLAEILRGNLSSSEKGQKKKGGRGGSDDVGPGRKPGFSL